jgi:hypothetical protein
VTIFFISTLAISIFGLVLLLGLKRWELSTGRVIGGSVRPAVGVKAHQWLAWFENVMPALMRQWARDSFRYLEVVLHRFAALCVLLAERGLEKVLKLLRHKTTVKHSDTEASAFLREVSAHKKQLIKATRKQRSIYEE